MLDYRGCWIIEDVGFWRMLDYGGCWIKEGFGLKRVYCILIMICCAFTWVHSHKRYLYHALEPCVVGHISTHN